MKSYKRHDKPPYSYLGMVALIIQCSPGRQQSLAGIIDTLTDMFPFFQGEYKGWKDSVRHNMTNSDCFYKVTS
ncbi:hypothetical protein LOTGIDRAFT_134143 [Lottia gigantea]|uniref:Fork-head domain-containing protein n=1 Tax=Lottia gigantea TaxID=225164 RepID=V3ZKV7_LOTGI|nr:hypothetical protein LOTGIDRAFT_134143 [Lottia gigantea]ESO83035.1 hypothetical protein LOTGIDRAFT_134143 [Lottia gigantea]